MVPETLACSDSECNPFPLLFITVNICRMRPATSVGLPAARDHTACSGHGSWMTGLPSLSLTAGPEYQTSSDREGRSYGLEAQVKTKHNGGGTRWRG